LPIRENDSKAVLAFETILAAAVGEPAPTVATSKLCSQVWAFLGLLQKNLLDLADFSI
jgi:hypothetical protein